MNEYFSTKIDSVVKKKCESILKRAEGEVISANEIELARILRKVYNNQPDMDDFKGAMAGTDLAFEYEAESIKHDYDYVEDRKRKIETVNSDKGQEHLSHLENNFVFAEVAQAMLTDLMNKWLPDFKTIMTTEFDDLHGVDIVTKYADGRYFGLALDATTAIKPDTINHKLQDNWERSILKAALPNVKYFQDPDTGEKGRISVPKFIIGISADDVEVMARAYLSKNEESLNFHPFRRVMLDQIEEQINCVLDFYDNTLEKNRPSNWLFIYKLYKKLYEVIRGVQSKLTISKIIDPMEYIENVKSNIAYSLMKEFTAKNVPKL